MTHLLDEPFQTMNGEQRPCATLVASVGWWSTSPAPAAPHPNMGLQELHEKHDDDRGRLPLQPIRGPGAWNTRRNMRVHLIQIQRLLPVNGEN